MGEHTEIDPIITAPAVEDGENESLQVSQTSPNNESAEDLNAASPTATIASNDPATKPQVPMQKRRRVTRACDECRRKKIKCDGKQPCTHCTVYSYECTYDQPSNRRRNPAPQYIEALEQRLQKAEAILQSVLPGIDFDDPKYEARGIEQIIESSKNRPPARQPQPSSRPDEDGQIQPMVDRVGNLDLDDHGNWDFHGHSSGYAFMRRFRAQFGEQYLPDSRVPPRARHISHVLESPRSAHSSPYETNLLTSVDLPPREAAIELCRNTLDDCCAVMRPLHRPTFFRRLHSIYDTEPDQYSNDQVKFLPLLYVVMAVGFLFSKSEHENSMLELKGYTEAIEQGYQFFIAGKQMLDITDCRDLMTIQAIFFMILFLQSSAKLATCYAYIGIALRACCRLGLHRNIPSGKFNAIELEERRRIFWLVRKIDGYVGAMLGLPQMLGDEDIDQELPLEVHDDYIREDGIQSMPTGVFPLIKATNAHTRLTFILRKVVRFIYPIKGSMSLLAGDKYTVSHGRIRELECDLQAWMDALPMELRPSEQAGMELSRVQQLLRISYAHVQMMMYRPFLHYVSQACQTGKADKRSFACAAACVSVARNIVHITSEMKRRGLLVGAYWFVMYTTFFAIVSLVYFVLENPNSPTGQDILKDALEGRDTLAGLAKRSYSADRCTNMLKSLFNELPEKLNERRNSSQPAHAGKKRPQPAGEYVQAELAQGSPLVATPKSEVGRPPSRARTLPHDYLTKIAKRNSMPDPPATQTAKLEEYGSSPQNPQLIGLNSPMIASPLSHQFEFTPQMANSQIPDLKNVMFPSDNPFAYPNQPISTLESVDARFAYPDQGSSIESPFGGSNENSIFGTPTSMPSQAQTQQQTPQHYDMNSLQRMYEENPQLAQQMAQHNRHMVAPMTGYSQDVSGAPGQQFDMAGPGQEDYWDQMSKGNIGSRIGFTSGAGVNLEELFGGDGWGSMWDNQGFS